MSQTYFKERGWAGASAADHEYFEAQLRGAGTQGKHSKDRLPRDTDRYFPFNFHSFHTLGRNFLFSHVCALVGFILCLFLPHGQLFSPPSCCFCFLSNHPTGADTWAASFILSERGAGRKRWQEWEPLSPLFPRAGSGASCVSSPQNTLQYHSAFPFEQESAFSFHSRAFSFCWWHQLAPRTLWTLCQAPTGARGLLQIDSSGCQWMQPRHSPARRALFGASDPEGGEPTGARVAQFIFFISLFLAHLLLMQNLRCARGRQRNECESRKMSDLSGDPY